jgi:hypothetical protein
MAKDQTRRLKPSIIETDRNDAASLQTIVGYAPLNPEYTAEAVATAQEDMDKARAKEAQAQAALDAARDDAASKEWNFHNRMIGVRDQVTAQFGRNSDEVQAVGRKKESERKAPGRASKKGGPA